MVLILIGEFAENKPGDDIKLVAHNSKIIGEDALYKIIVPTYMGLFSSGGNGTSEKFGTIPLEQNRSALAWACSTNDTGKSRLLVTVVPSNEVSDITSKVAKDTVQERINQLKAILTNEQMDQDALDRAISLLDSSLTSDSEVNRLSDVFGQEI